MVLTIGIDSSAKEKMISFLFKKLLQSKNQTLRQNHTIFHMATLSSPEMVPDKFDGGYLASCPTTPPQVPTCNPSHLKQKIKLHTTSLEAQVHAPQCNFRVQIPNFPTFTLHKITSETPGKNIQAHSHILA